MTEHMPILKSCPLWLEPIWLLQNFQTGYVHAMR